MSNLKTKIDDFGEHIPGAAKHRAAQRRWEYEMSSGQTSQTGATLNTVWPQPKWDTLIEEGWPVAGVAAARSFRDLMPSAPTSKWDKKSWLDYAKEGALISLDIARDGPDEHADRANEFVEKMPYFSGSSGLNLRQWRQHSLFYLHGGHQTSFRGARFTSKDTVTRVYHTFEPKHLKDERWSFVVEGPMRRGLPTELLHAHEDIDELASDVHLTFEETHPDQRPKGSKAWRKWHARWSEAIG